MKNSTRLGFGVAASVVAQVMSLATAHAVPSDKEAWSNLEQKITVYHDAIDPEVFWFVPKIRFDSKVLVPKTMLNGKVEYTTRIIPYFNKDLRDLVAANIPGIRQQSQLKPVVAKSIGIALPDFAYKFAGPTVTNYQYLEVARPIRFQLDPEEAASFDELYADDYGVPVEFTIAYDGVKADKFYNIEVSCKSMERELSTNFKPSVGITAPVKGAKVFLGADLEFAFLNTVQNSTNSVNIVSKGDIPGMQEMLRRVLNLCFAPVDSYGSTYDPVDDRPFPRRSPLPDDGVPPRRTTPRRGDVIDDGFTPRNQFTSSIMKLAEQEANLMKAIVNNLDLDRVDCDKAKDPDCKDEEPTIPRRGGDEPGLLPSAQLKMGYTFKKTALDKDNQAVVKQVSMTDAISTTTLVEVLSASRKGAEKVVVQPIAEKKFTVTVKNPASAPLRTGIVVHENEQYTINAEFTFNAISGYSPWKAKQYAWDASWPTTEGDLYYRIGSGKWTAVKRHAAIASDVTAGGGELQFYLDRSAIFNKIPEKLRKGNILVGPAFTIDGISPLFTVQVSGRRVTVQ